MNIFSNILISGLSAAAAAILGAYGARRLGDKIRKSEIYIISLAAGLLLANAFFHLLPEAIELASSWPYWLLGAMVLLYLLEQSLMIHSCCEEHCAAHAIGLMSLVGLGFHSMVDGLMIGVSFEVGFGVGLASSVAIIFHKIAEGTCTYFLLARDEKLKKRAWLFSWLVALATPLGALAAFIFLRPSASSFLGVFLALAAGTFVYIGASDLLPATHRQSNWKNILFLFLGIIFVYFIGRLAG